ncbi:entericidin A/B family lipoprotein [Pseudomarimonas arenosa]|uniref:entericidin A/B family lipoprotein n=1 Tax=Pseudomarimonas arenosa TaxID=2774145 RepID=UPI001CDCB3BB|nr:entericidin A/B family lipoprotein [Pseudomarimonas arenosa]
MKNTLRIALTLLTTTGFALGLSACNTMHGLGRDTQVVGEKIEKEADRHIDNKHDDGRPGHEHERPTQGEM